MLRVTKRDQGDSVNFKLEGKLAGCWVDVMEQAWKRALADAPDRPVLIDLSGITYADAHGTELLGRMYRAGASLHATSLLAKGIVEDIESHQGEPAKTGL